MHRTLVRSWFQVALALGSIAVTLPTRADVAAPSHSLELGAGVGYRLAQDFIVAQPPSSCSGDSGARTAIIDDQELDTLVFAGVTGRFHL